MSDFVQTMMDWRRMCKAYTTDDKSCCYGCPVADFREHGCGAIFEMEDSTDWERYEGAIREWAAEHPEPVYPTWVEWLVNKGVLLDYMPVPTLTVKAWYGGVNAQKPIPADIAQNLGLEPKEG